VDERRKRVIVHCGLDPRSPKTGLLRSRQVGAGYEVRR
jgi:hypothetical protein